ncbi:hypothetical protein [Mycobacteroides abscessus]|uniref:hypothetical protein n=1 Tax=Mycobacteroides abscessus TaxID=36809 RepID=UPI0012FFE9B2|nr:hypothetical protein [Mycobacteroides abscessus]
MPRTWAEGTAWPEAPGLCVEAAIGERLTKAVPDASISGLLATGAPVCIAVGNERIGVSERW